MHLQLALLELVLIKLLTRSVEQTHRGCFASIIRLDALVVDFIMVIVKCRRGTRWLLVVVDETEIQRREGMC
jgi:hypothetical protein